VQASGHGGGTWKEDAPAVASMLWTMKTRQRRLAGATTLHSEAARTLPTYRQTRCAVHQGADIGRPILA
jgi:hypothetical protein